jgi:putative protease
LSARPDAWSLDIDGICAATKMAHDSGRRIYVAMNAEYRDAQTTKIGSVVEKMCGFGVDALIVGDFGLLHHLKSIECSIPIHASTLLGIYNVEGIRFLNEQFGVKRVVLNTNLYVDEIASLHFHCPTVELELIAHGGVCFNDNRRCRQPHYLFEGEFCVGCKQIYEVYPNSSATIPLTPVSTVASQVRPSDIDLGGGRLIWSPEIDLSGIVGLFMRLGVVSFKIEGRTRETDYITMSTQRLRSAIDGVLSDPVLVSGELNPYFYLAHHADLAPRR